MNTAMQRGWKTAKHHKRVAWLKDHPQLSALPSTTQDVTDAQSALLTEIAAAMRKDGLFSPHTALSDVKWSIRLCVGEART